MIEHTNSQPNPGLRADGTPYIFMKCKLKRVLKDVVFPRLLIFLLTNWPLIGMNNRDAGRGRGATVLGPPLHVPKDREALGGRLRGSQT